MGFAAFNMIQESSMTSLIPRIVSMRLKRSSKIIRSRQNVLDVMGATGNDPRIMCSEKDGTVAWRYKRCIAMRHEGAALNFTEQKLACKKQDMIFAYPRTMEESRYIRNFYKEKSSVLNHCHSLETGLTIGYQAMQATQYTAPLTSPGGKWYIPTQVRNPEEEHNLGVVAELEIPSDVMRSLFLYSFGFDLLCYRSESSLFDFCGETAKRRCHICFVDN